jgi:hypothetical protein
MFINNSPALFRVSSFMFGLDCISLQIDHAHTNNKKNPWKSRGFLKIFRRIIKMSGLRPGRFYLY